MSQIYSTWYNMIQRCTNDHNIDFKNYGGRGIRVCERWIDPVLVKTQSRPRKHGFINFLEDMGADWFPGATIDRINNDGDYTPENCQWLTRNENVKKENIDNVEHGKHPFVGGTIQTESNKKRVETGTHNLLKINNPNNPAQQVIDGTHPWLKQNRKPGVSYGGIAVGWKHSEESIDRIRSAALLRKKCTCEICGKEVSINIYSRFHGRKCKWKY